MTFSIVARSAERAEWGVAVASKFLAVGAVVGVENFEMRVRDERIDKGVLQVLREQAQPHLT